MDRRGGGGGEGGDREGFGLENMPLGWFCDCLFCALLACGARKGVEGGGGGRLGIVCVSMAPIRGRSFILS